MSSLKTFKLTHLPNDLSVYVELYYSVKNAAFLQKQLLEGNMTYEYAFIDASVIAESFRRFGISPATTALYAIKVSKTSSINAATVGQHLSDSIEGTSLPFQEAEISKFTDITKVQKIYKLADTGKSSNKAGGKAKKGRREEDIDAISVTGAGGKGGTEKRELEMMVLGLMALRGAT